MTKISKFRGLVLPLLFSVLGALLCVQAWRYAGLIGRIGEWQFSDIDIYFPGVTVLLLLLLVLIPVVLVALMLRRRRARTERVDPDVPSADDSYRLSLASSTTRMRTLYAIAGIGALGMLVSLAIPFARDAGGSFAGAVDFAEHVDAAGLSSRLNGRIDVNHIAIYRRGVGLIRHDVYVAPIVLRGTVVTRDPQRYFAEVAASDLDGGTTAPAMSGYLRQVAFPKQLVALYRDHGITVAPDAFMLFATRESRDWSCYVAAIQFFIFGLFALVMASVFRWRRRRAIEHMAGLALPEHRITRR